MDTASRIAENITVALTFISLFAGIFLAWYFYLKAKQKERLALIEKVSEGIDFSKFDFANFFERPNKRQFKFRFPWLKLGILIFSITFGLSIGVILWKIDKVPNDFIPILGFMFGGLGMIAAHFADKKEDSKTN